jgi:hypothetical protein
MGTETGRGGNKMIKIKQILCHAWEFIKNVFRLKYNNTQVKLAFKARVIRKMAETIKDEIPAVRLCKHCAYGDQDCTRKDCVTGIIKWMEKEVREEMK